MQSISTIGLDIAKSVFQVHGVEKYSAADCSIGCRDPVHSARPVVGTGCTLNKFPAQPQRRYFRFVSQTVREAHPKIMKGRHHETVRRLYW